jgi:MFS transporter, FHS family, glucose/mannose:H+ symporter
VDEHRLRVNHDTQTNRLTLPVIAASFVLVGVMTTMSGVLLPFLSTRYSMPAATTAWLFPAQFCCGATGVLSSGLILRRFGFRAALGVGYLLLASGAALFALGTWPGILAGVGMYGIGIGILNPSSNLAAGTLSRRGPVMVNALNFCWGAGAVAGPMILPTLLSRNGPSAVAYMLAPLIAVAGVGVLLVVPSGTAGPPPAGEKGGIANAVLSGVMLLGYVGTETTIAGWMPLYGMRALGASAVQAGLTLSIVWGALLAGRAAGPFLVSRVGIDRMLRTSFVLMAAGMGIIATFHTLPALMFGCMVSGLGLATVFPNVVAAYTASGGRNVSVVFLMASAGGATLPWIAGRLVSATGYPLAALLPAAAPTLLISAVWTVLRRRLAGIV